MDQQMKEFLEMQKQQAADFMAMMIAQRSAVPPSPEADAALAHIAAATASPEAEVAAPKKTVVSVNPPTPNQLKRMRERKRMEKRIRAQIAEEAAATAATVAPSTGKSIEELEAENKELEEEHAEKQREESAAKADELRKQGECAKEQRTLAADFDNPDERSVTEVDDDSVGETEYAFGGAEAKESADTDSEEEEQTVSRKRKSKPTNFYKPGAKKGGRVKKTAKKAVSKKDSQKAYKVISKEIVREIVNEKGGVLYYGGKRPDYNEFARAFDRHLSGVTRKMIELILEKAEGKKLNKSMFEGRVFKVKWMKKDRKKE